MFFLFREEIIPGHSYLLSMYSLRIQLLAITLIAAIGGAIAFYNHTSLVVSSLILLAIIVIAYGFLNVLVYRPLQRIQRVVTAQEDKSSVQRVNASSSDEFQYLSESCNSILDSFSTDIRQLEKCEMFGVEVLGNVPH